MNRVKFVRTGYEGIYMYEKPRVIQALKCKLSRNDAKYFKEMGKKFLKISCTPLNFCKSVRKTSLNPPKYVFCRSLPHNLLENGNSSSFTIFLLNSNWL